MGKSGHKASISLKILIFWDTMPCHWLILTTYPLKIHILKDLNLHQHCCENLKSCNYWILQKESAP